MQDTMLRLCASTALVGALTLPATAQQIINLEEITFSANLVPVEVDRTGVSVLILEREEIERTAELQINAILARKPGITMTQRGPIGTSGNVRIRGVDERYFPVFINGINMSDPSELQGQFSFSGLTSSAVSRLEILKGSQSARFGANAIAGVVNLSLGEIPDEVGTLTTLGAEFGSFNTKRLSLSFAQRFERGEIALTAERVLTDGFSAAEENDGNTEADGFRSTILSLRARHELSESVAIGASAFYQNSFTEFDAFGGPGGDDPDRFGLLERYGVRGFVEFSTGAVDHEVSVEHSDTKRADPNAPAFFTTTDFQGRRTSLSYQGGVEISPHSAVSFGAQYIRENYVAFRPGGGQFSGRVTRRAVFGEYRVAPTETVDVSLSARYERDSRFGGKTTGRAAMAWRPDQFTVVRASAATGFRAPSANELFGPFGANPDLDPETSRSFDLGIERRFGALTAEAGVFRTDITDLIGFDGGYVQVLGRSRLQGVELSARYDVSDALTLTGAFTYTDTRTPAGDPVGNVPKRDFAAGVDWEIFEGLRNSTTLAASSRRFGFGGSSIPGFAVVNTTFRYDLTERAELSLRIENLFDRQYQTVAGFGTSDRAFYLGVASRF